MNGCISFQIEDVVRCVIGWPTDSRCPAIRKRGTCRRIPPPVLGVLSLLLVGLAVQAQPFSVDWHKVSGGGGTSTGGVYSVSGTIGQHDAGGPMTGGGYSVTGGFWALYAVQTPGAPLLTITYSGGTTAVVSWPLSVTGWTLQTNTDLRIGTWGNYLGPVVNNSATVTSKVGNLFFRLKQ
jgi:hypothetical protein